jgi:asparagine synthase (glutamine-hydrolysing)
VPPPSPNLFFWFPLLRRAASDGVSSLLDGEGGDELFGLSPYLIADRLRRGRPRAAVDVVRDIPGGGPHLTRQQIRPFLREYGFKGAAPYWLHRLVRRRHRAGAPSWLLPPTVDALVATDLDGRWKRLPGPRWWAYVVDAVTQGRGASATHDHVRRRAAMCGIEPRHALVDPDVVEFVLTIPPELHFDRRHNRPLVREALVGLLPDEVRLRPAKSSFDALFHESMAGPDLDVARRLLDPAEARVSAFVDLAAVHDELLADPPPPGHRMLWAQLVWRLVTVECALRVGTGDDLGWIEAPGPDGGVRITP